MHLSPQWLWLLSILRRWFCCCWFVVDCSLWDSVNVLCFAIVRYFVSILVLESSRWEREREMVALLCLSSWCLMIFVWHPHYATGLHAVCDYGISWSNSLTIFDYWVYIIHIVKNNIKNSKWVWSGNTTITNYRQPPARKSRSTITRHQDDKLSKVTSSNTVVFLPVYCGL